MRSVRPGRELVLGTAGHIDHGKTALVRALTGVDTDRLPAEKRRGITIDLGFAALDLGTTRLALVDVPGHERFIRNMLAGATGLDLALLVVAADDSVMPQTREHLEILRLLGLSGGVIAMTKCDLADPDWMDMVEDDLQELVAGTFLDEAPIVRTSAMSGMGLDDLREHLRVLAEATLGRPDPGPFRMAIDRAFTLAGLGAVVTGSIASGAVAVGDELQWMPAGRQVRVRGLQQHGASVERLVRGTRAAINLAGIHHAEIRRGQELATPGYLRATRMLSVELGASHSAPWPLKHRSRYRLHLGTAEVGASLSLLEAGLLEPGSLGLAQLALAEPVVAAHGQPFVLRSESPPATLGGGRILQPVARRIRRRDAAAIGHLGRMGSPDAIERASTAMLVHGLVPWTPHDLVREAGLNQAEVSDVLARMSATGALVELPVGPRRRVSLSRELITGLESRILRVLGRLHETRSRQSAIRRAQVVTAMPDLAGDPLIGSVIDLLLARGTLVGDARSVALREFQPRLTQTERKLKNEIAEAYQTAKLTPPEVAEFSARAGSRASVVPELMALLVDEGCLVVLDADHYLDSEAEADLRRRVSEALADGSGMTMAGLRDLLGITRKHAVPFGEYLDRIGLTHREGDVRRLVPAAVSEPELEIPNA